jgi:exodeoxyribonuclease VII small subunit
VATVPSNAKSQGATPSPEFTDIAQLSYEAARDELVAIVARLEGGEAGLEESMRLWRRGEALAAHCSTWLDDAEASLRGTADEEG